MVPEPPDAETMRRALPRHFEFSTLDREGLDDLDATLGQVGRNYRTPVAILALFSHLWDVVAYI